MSTHYIDLHLRQEPEVAPHQLMSGLYVCLHRALAQLGSQDIGLSFPAHDERKPCLGSHMRLHGTQDGLQALMGSAWLRGMQDHLQVGSVSAVPGQISHRQVIRVQAKSNAERLRRRAIKRHGLDAAEAAHRIPDAAEKRLKLPFVTLGSRSTGQSSFPVFIRHGPLLDAPLSGAFNSYALSLGASIPWF